MGVFDATATVLRRLGTVGEVPARAVELYGEAVGLAERTLWGYVRARVDEVDPPVAGELEGPRTRPRPEPVEGPRAIMSALLGASLDQDAISSERDYLVALLRQLLPDEARIIAALADGPPAPTVSIYRRGTSELLLENASLVGRSAAVTLPSRTTRYVAHLLHLGLVELGPEDKENSVGYELVLADRQVRPALKEGARGKLPARVERTTLRLSEHGRALWEATRPDGGLP
jgi:hypothetical protein